MRPRLVVASLAVLLAASDTGCRAPTEITLAIATDVKCSEFRGSSVTIGRLHEIESKAVTATSLTCDDQGNLGSLVVIPSGDTDDEVAVKVIAGLERDPASCLAPAYGKGCIVARRALRFVPHQQLRIAVPLRAICDGIPCGETETCADGTCVPADDPRAGDCLDADASCAPMPPASTSDGGGVELGCPATINGPQGAAFERSCTVVQGPDGGAPVYSLAAPAECPGFQIARDGKVSGTIGAASCNLQVSLTIAGATDQKTIMVVPTLAQAVPGTYDASTMDLIWDHGRTTAAIAFNDAAYVLKKGGALRSVSDTLPGANDIPMDLRLDHTRGFVYFSAQTSVMARKLFKVDLGSAATTPLGMLDAISGTNPAGDDQPLYLTLDETRGLVYFSADNGVKGPALYRIDSNASASNRVTGGMGLSNTYSGGADFPEGFVLHPTLDMLFFNSRSVFTSGSSETYGLYRATSTTSSSAPIVLADRLSNTRSSFPNDYPVALSFDLTRHSVYFLGLYNDSPLYYQKVYRFDVSGSVPVQHTDYLITATGTCADIQLDEAHDALYARCVTATGDKLFRVTSAVTAAAKLAESDAISAINPGASDKIVWMKADTKNGWLYVAATLANGTTQIFRVDASHTSTSPLKSNGGLLAIYPAGDSAPQHFVFDATDSVLFFDAAINALGQRKLFKIDASITTNRKLTAADAISNTSAGGDDLPSMVVVDEPTGTLFVTAKNANGFQKLFGSTVSATVPLRSENAMTNINAAGDDGIDSIFTSGADGLVFFLAKPGGGVKRFYSLDTTFKN